MLFWFVLNNTELKITAIARNYIKNKNKKKTQLSFGSLLQVHAFTKLTFFFLSYICGAYKWWCYVKGKLVLCYKKSKGILFRYSWPRVFVMHSININNESSRSIATGQSQTTNTDCNSPALWHAVCTLARVIRRPLQLLLPPWASLPLLLDKRNDILGNSGARGPFSVASHKK